MNPSARASADGCGPAPWGVCTLASAPCGGQPAPLAVIGVEGEQPPLKLASYLRPRLRGGGRRCPAREDRGVLPASSRRAAQCVVAADGTLEMNWSKSRDSPPWSPSFWPLIPILPPCQNAVRLGSKALLLCRSGLTPCSETEAQAEVQ